MGTITPAEKIDEIRRVYAQTGNVTHTARICKVSRSTVQRYMKESPHVPPAEPQLPDPAPEAGGPRLPDPVELTYERFKIDTTGHWLVLSDIHIPFHDKRVLELAVKEGRERNVAGVLLNGDILDCGAVSSHYREPDETRLEEEIDAGEQFLAWLRSKFPKARIVWKEGNHEQRLRRYIVNNAPSLAGLKGITIPKLCNADKYGVEWVQDKRVIDLGKLPVLHGHEFRGGGGVNPARWLFLRSVSTAMCGHFHRTSEHHEQSLDERLHGVWSVGCMCYLRPQYDPLNKWNHGYAAVEVASSGHFRVSNRRMLRDGTLV